MLCLVPHVVAPCVCEVIFEQYYMKSVHVNFWLTSTINHTKKFKIHMSIEIIEK